MEEQRTSPATHCACLPSPTLPFAFRRCARGPLPLAHATHCAACIVRGARVGVCCTLCGCAPHSHCIVRCARVGAAVPSVGMLRTHTASCVARVWGWCTLRGSARYACHYGHFLPTTAAEELSHPANGHLAVTAPGTATGTAPTAAPHRPAAPAAKLASRPAPKESAAATPAAATAARADQAENTSPRAGAADRSGQGWHVSTVRLFGVQCARPRPCAIAYRRAVPHADPCCACILHLRSWESPRLDVT